MINAALAFGPKAHIMTNDLFKDHIQKLSPKVGELFKMWYESVNIRFSKKSYAMRVSLPINQIDVIKII